MDSVSVNDRLLIGPKNKLVLIAGPCVLETEEIARKTAERLQAITKRLAIPFVFKASFDKANRTSLSSYRGPGVEEGVAILGRIKKDFDIPVISDVHEPSQIEKVAEVLDIIQIPAFLCRQTDLLVAASATGKVVSVKKGQFMSPWDMQHVVSKLKEGGNRKILLT